MAKRKMNFGAVHDQMKTENKIPDVIASESHPEETKSLTQTLLTEIETAELDYNRKAFDVRLVPRNKIIFHDGNDYPMESIEKLADSILDLGLIHNIEVFYNEERDIYIVDAGERRTRAIDLLVQKYDNYEDQQNTAFKKYLKNIKVFSVEGYPCSVKQPTKITDLDNPELSENDVRELDSLNTRIRLIESNESGRSYDSVRQQQKAVELAEYYRQKNELLKGKKININATVGEVLGISERQVKKLNAVSKLIPELYSIFEKNGITIAEGANYAQLNEEEQHQILALIETGENKKEINTLYNRLKKMQDEIENQKKDIKKLEEEKEAAEAKIGDEKKKAAELESKIKAELESSNPNATKVKSLQEELDQAEADLSEIKRKYNEQTKEQAEQIKELEKQLKEKEKSNKKISVSSTTRTAMQIESNIESIKRTVQELKDNIKKYHENYDSESGEKTPEEYEKKIMNYLNW